MNALLLAVVLWVATDVIAPVKPPPCHLWSITDWEYWFHSCWMFNYDAMIAVGSAIGITGYLLLRMITKGR